MDWHDILRGARAGSPPRHLSRRIDALKDELADLADALNDVGAEKRRATGRVARAGVDAAGALSRDLRRRTGELLDDRPAASLGLAVLFGIVVGILLARR